MQLSPNKIDANFKKSLQTQTWHLVFGGSFDPVHLGHLNLVKQLLDIFQPKKFHLMPCAIPALKQKFSTSDADRIKMLELAFANFADNLIIDKREINRTGVSYTFDSLYEIQTQLQKDAKANKAAEKDAKPQLGFIIGSDLLAQLHLWHRIEEFVQITNLIVIKRPSKRLNQPDVLQNFSTFSAKNSPQATGKLIVLELNQMLKISSSYIRTALANGAKVDKLLTTETLRYIKEHKLYTGKL